MKKTLLYALALMPFVVAVSQAESSRSSKELTSGEAGDNTRRISPEYSGQLQSLGQFSDQRPLPLARDGDVRTWAWPTQGKGPLDYFITYDEPETVSYVRFWQHPWCYATEFQIQADTNGDGEYDTILLEVDDPLVKTGEWAEYSFSPTEAHAVRFRTISGIGLRMPFPALAEIYLRHGSLNASAPAAQPLSIEVAPDAVLEIGGVSQITPAMFNFCWGAVNQRSEIVRKYLEPLNLGELTVWGHMWGDRPLAEPSRERPGSVVIPEDPQRPGHFDRNFFTSGAYRAWFSKNHIRIYEEAKTMGIAICEMLGKVPAYMQRTDFKSTAAGKYEGETQFFPPQDPAEWGQLVGLTLQEINKATEGAVERGYIWNEPNSTRYWPVPWRDKAETYIQLFEGAVPEIKALNPELEIGGPVLTGAGPLGWGNGHEGWETWARPFIDRCGDLADFYDNHCYYSGIDNLYAESSLIAGYSLQQLGKTLPLASTEAAPHLGTHGVKELDDVALTWRNGALPTVTVLLKLLDMPEKWVSYARFYYKGWVGLSIFDDNDEPEPTYCAYWVLRNLRGQRLPASFPEKDLVVVAAGEDGRYVVAVQNLSQQRRSVTLDMPLGYVKTTKVGIDYLEYDSQAGKLAHGTRPVAYDGQSVRWEVEPLGLYAVTFETASLETAKRSLVRREYFGDRFFQPLPEAASEEFVIEVPDDIARKAEKAWLTFGTAGSGELREDRPRVTFGYTVPLSIKLSNGRHYTVEAGKWNQLEIDFSTHQGLFSVTFERQNADPADPLQVNPDEYWLMSVSLITEQWEG